MSTPLDRPIVKTLPPARRGNGRSEEYRVMARWMDELDSDNPNPAPDANWILVGTFGYGTIVSAFNGGRYVAFPKGVYEFRSRKASDGRWNIFGRRKPTPAEKVES